MTTWWMYEERLKELEKKIRALEKLLNERDLEIMDLKDILLDLAPDYEYEKKEWEDAK